MCNVHAYVSCMLDTSCICTNNLAYVYMMHVLCSNSWDTSEIDNTCTSYCTHCTHDEFWSNTHVHAYIHMYILYKSSQKRRTNKNKWFYTCCIHIHIMWIWSAHNIYLHVQMYIHIYTTYVSVCIYVNTCRKVFIYINTLKLKPKSFWEHLNIRVYVYLIVNTHVWGYIHVHIYVHHTCIHMHIVISYR